MLPIFELFLSSDHGIKSRAVWHCWQFELSARNATYDVLWGVPDGEGLLCTKTPLPSPKVPICVNTSFAGYDGTWTMATRDPRAPGGLKTAISYSRGEYGRFHAPYALWTAELRFPMRSSSDNASSHGGLLDAGYPYGASFEHVDPSRALPGPIYWQFDLSRAEHPRRYTKQVAAGAETAEEHIYCPLGCTQGNLTSWRPSLSSLSRAECAEVRTKWPTLLGIDPWNCYWEWALSAVGPNAYMHRPLYWATLQFAEHAKPAAGTLNVGAPASINSTTCGQLEWPGRYLARLIYVAQRAVFKHGGAAAPSYTRSPSALVNACEQAPGCSAPDLRYALSLTNRFTIEISLENGTSATVAGRMPPWPSPQQQLLRAQPANQGAPEEATSKNLGHALGLDPVPLRCELPSPCFVARVTVRGDGYAYYTTIDSNSRVSTTFLSGRGRCLFVSSQHSLWPSDVLVM